MPWPTARQAPETTVRFDLTFRILAPEIEIITPTRDMTLTREYEIDYLKKHGIEADFKKMEYSINKGLGAPA